ncbi:coniferyl aldehyde dehydrogenase [Aurantimonas marina]|uniref:coniferyl aldehyde dehydrogenase n=1 Tax=Aurantimonas marina TaxID=2780508 RepID=UPI0019D13182|nr:coniferyl aldehyde dehydrogenase [Aurantimonas marina]
MPQDAEATADGAVPDRALSAVFQRQRQASRREATPDLEARRDALDRLRGMVTDNRSAIAEAISQDFGNRSRDETDLLEVVPTLGAIRYARRKLGGWMKPQRRHVDLAFQPARAWVQHEPLGVVGIIAPWNYPLLLALSPLVEALAAGNRVMVKPSELAPRFADLLQRLVAERFDPEQVAVVTGGVEAAQRFSSLPFDHLLFTGSTAVGRKVMQAAAENLTPVTLELGGKSPAIVCPDYPLEKAASSIAFGKFLNAGQTCIAPDYALVPADKIAAFAEAVMASAHRAYPAIAGNDDYSAIIGDRHYQRLRDAVETVRSEGATVLSHEDSGADSGRKMGPTVVFGAAPESLLMTEEIFGPVLPILGYDSLDDAIRHVAARDRPLALYCFSDDKADQAKVLDGTMSGGVTLNGTLLHVAQESLPFGGVGMSGMGAYHGFDGFRRLSHARSVYKVGAFNVFERLGPPWGKRARMASWLLSRR